MSLLPADLPSLEVKLIVISSFQVCVRVLFFGNETGTEVAITGSLFLLYDSGRLAALRLFFFSLLVVVMLSAAGEKTVFEGDDLDFGGRVQVVVEKILEVLLGLVRLLRLSVAT